jgi:hypothetical protein
MSIFKPNAICVELDSKQILLETTEHGYVNFKINDKEIILLDREEILSLIKMLVQIYAEIE